MTIEEIFRRIIKARLALILLCALLSLGAVIGLHYRTPPTWVAKVRMQVSSVAPASSTEASGLSSRVLALATTPALVRTALHDAHVRRDVLDVATHHITAEGLGESSVVELSVSDADRAAAGRIATALSQHVAEFMNEGDRARFNAAVAHLDTRVASATAARDALVVRLRKAAGLVTQGSVKALLENAQANLDQLVAQRSSFQLTDVSRDHVVVLDADAPTVLEAPSQLIPRSALALLLGIVLGLTLSVVLEALRPRIAGIRALSRILRAPLLGTTEEAHASLVNSVTLAARRQGVETVVLIGVDERDEKAARRLLGELPHSWWSTDDLSAQVEASAWITRAAGQSQTPPPDADYGAGFDSQHISLSHNVRFTDVYGVRQGEEPGAGLLVVCGGSARQTNLDHVNDVVQAMRWPVIGVLENTAHRHWRLRR
ncbi:MAG: hypothetical protein ACRDPB_09075 [Nocardioidaceae bacterium]